MTGTSCDGADLAALKIEFTGNRITRETLGERLSAKFPSALRRKFREAQKGRLAISATAELTRDYSLWIGTLCARFLRRACIPMRKTTLAIHGQTIWHQPPHGVSSGFSVQLVDPAVIAHACHCTVTAFFRQPDLARGGQGAPLVPYYHWLRARSTEFSALLPFAIHNVGGIANLTYVTRDASDIIAFDTGPGNALIDLAMERHSNGRKHFDRGGRTAAAALEHVNWRAVKHLAQHAYFRQKPPKSTGRELFDERFLARFKASGQALVATATAFTAHTMAKAYADHVVNRARSPRFIFVAGGGAQNGTLVQLFSRELQRLTGKTIAVRPLPASFAPPEYLEAMAFARLGFEALFGRPISLSNVTGASEDAFGAGIFPGKNFPELLKMIRA